VLELKNCIKDALRFTMLFPPDQYVDGVLATEDVLLHGAPPSAEHAGSTTSTSAADIGVPAIAESMRVKNYWQLASNSASCYQGINCQVELRPFEEGGERYDPQGCKFELQFHTPASFLIKDKLAHVPYEVRPCSKCCRLSVCRSPASTRRGGHGGVTGGGGSQRDCE
jgi:hypothetical protein